MSSALGDGHCHGMTEHNHVTLAGRISADPEVRVLPSGDRLVSFRLIVPRSVAARRRSKQPVDTIECSAWTQKLRRSVSRLEAGSHVVVTGELRRRFSRNGGGLISRVSVDLDSCEPLATAPVTSQA